MTDTNNKNKKLNYENIILLFCSLVIGLWLCLSFAYISATQGFMGGVMAFFIISISFSFYIVENTDFYIRG